MADLSYRKRCSHQAAGSSLNVSKSVHPFLSIAGEWGDPNANVLSSGQNKGCSLETLRRSGNNHCGGRVEAVDLDPGSFTTSCKECMEGSWTLLMMAARRSLVRHRTTWRSCWWTMGRLGLGCISTNGHGSGSARSRASSLPTTTSSANWVLVGIYGRYTQDFGPFQCHKASVARDAARIAG
jgi:hypothetical protein